MELVTYKDIAARHGRPYALNLLRVIENLAKIRNEIIIMDCEARFDKATKTLCRIDPEQQP